MKNKWNVLGIIVFIMIIGFLIAGCDNPSNSKDLPVSFVEYKLGKDGFYQIYTNDSEHYGFSMWELYENTNEDQNTYKIECKKISGSVVDAYGMIFGAEHENPYNFYAVAISTEGFYTVWKNKGDENDYDFEELIPEEDADEYGWAESESLNIGYNKINTIKVTKSGSNYTVYLNDDEVLTFADSEFTGDKIGFYTAIGYEEDESFPNTPVDVRFRQK
jgi:hypothetical protein